MKRRSIKNYEELLPFVDEVGFLPLFPGIIPGFSLWESTRQSSWFTGREESDPWFWRQRCAAEGKLAYGKFFNGKAGFISQKWLPEFVHFRRNGMSFEENFRKGRLSSDAKRIMDLYLCGDEYPSFQIKKLTGLTKQFDLRLTRLQHAAFLVTCDFFRRRSKSGSEYGWAVAVLCKAESLFGIDLILSRFSDPPEESYAKMLDHCSGLFPKIPESVWRKFLS